MNEKITYALLGGVGVFFFPLYILLLWMFIFVISDMVSGMLAARQRREKLTSKKLKKTVSKIAWYSSVIILVHGLDKSVLPFVDLYAAQIVTGIICGVELYSNLENLYCITDNRVFYLLTQWTTKKIHDSTGVDIGNEK